MSYSSTWEHLLSLTREAELLSKVQSGHWIWAYDNLNIHSHTRHERQGMCTLLPQCREVYNLLQIMATVMHTH